MSSEDEIGDDDKNKVYCEELALKFKPPCICGALYSSTYFDTCIDPVIYRYHAFLSIRMRNNLYEAR